MLDNPIVDVALGLILLYTVLSLFASVVKEWISTFLGLRAKNLEKGIQTLIGADYAAKLYDHPLVSTLAIEKKLPSYIGSGTFALALVDLLAHGEEEQSNADTEDNVAQLIQNASGDPVLGRALRALSSTGVQTMAELRTEIAAWFDESMNRVSVAASHRRELRQVQGIRRYVRCARGSAGRSSGSNRLLRAHCLRGSRSSCRGGLDRATPAWKSRKARSGMTTAPIWPVTAQRRGNGWASSRPHHRSGDRGSPFHRGSRISSPL